MKAEWKQSLSEHWLEAGKRYICVRKLSEGHWEWYGHGLGGYADTRESAQSAAIAAVRAQCKEILEALP